MLFKGVTVHTLVHVDGVLAGDHILERRAGLTVVDVEEGLITCLWYILQLLLQCAMHGAL